jgi:hypothetical protein
LGLTLVYVLTAREIGAVDDFNVASGIQVCACAAVSGQDGQHRRPVPPREDHWMSGSLTEICSRKPTYGPQGTLQNSRYHG